MKIGIISNLYDAHARGGAEKIAKLMASRLTEKHDVFVITTEPFESLQSLAVKKSVDERVGVYQFFPLNIYSYINGYKYWTPIRLIWHFFDMFNFHAARKIKEILKDEKPDVVIGHNLKGIGYLTPRVCKKLNVPYVQVLHDVQYAVPSGLVIFGKEKSFEVNGFLVRWYQVVCRWLFKSVTIVVSPSAWLMDFYAERRYFFSAEKKVLPNPITLPVKKRDLIPKGDSLYNQFLFLGQLEEHKGIRMLCEEIKQFPKAQLTVAGTGSLLKELKKKYEHVSNITFLGFVPPTDINDLFKMTDWLVVPSKCYENSPTVIYEAFSNGIPVIGARIGGIPELVTEAKTGLLFTPGDANELREKIHAAMEYREYNQLSRGGHAVIHQRNATHYFEVLEDILYVAE